LDAVVRHCLESLGGDRGFLVLKRGESLDFKVVRNWSREELDPGREPVSRSIVGEVLRQGQAMLIEDTLSDPRFAHLESVLKLKIRSVLAAPLWIDGRIVGALYLESRTLDRLFGPEQFALFGQLLELASRAIQASTRRLLLEQR